MHTFIAARIKYSIPNIKHVHVKEVKECGLNDSLINFSLTQFRLSMGREVCIGPFLYTRKSKSELWLLFGTLLVVFMYASI